MLDLPLWESIRDEHHTDTDPDPTRLAFDQWIPTLDGERMLNECVNRARRLKRRGFKSVGIELIWIAVRYSRALKFGPDAEGYKLNNNHRSLMSRFIEDNYPDLRGFFTKKKRHAETMESTPK